MSSKKFQKKSVPVPLRDFVGSSQRDDNGPPMTSASRRAVENSAVVPRVDAKAIAEAMQVGPEIAQSSFSTAVVQVIKDIRSRGDFPTSLELSTQLRGAPFNINVNSLRDETDKKLWQRMLLQLRILDDALPIVCKSASFMTLHDVEVVIKDLYQFRRDKTDPFKLYGCLTHHPYLKKLLADGYLLLDRGCAIRGHYEAVTSADIVPHVMQSVSEYIRRVHGQSSSFMSIDRFKDSLTDEAFDLCLQEGLADFATASVVERCVSFDPTSVGVICLPVMKFWPVYASQYISAAEKRREQLELNVRSAIRAAEENSSMKHCETIIRDLRVSLSNVEPRSQPRLIANVLLQQLRKFVKAKSLSYDRDGQQVLPGPDEYVITEYQCMMFLHEFVVPLFLADFVDTVTESNSSLKSDVHGRSSVDTNALHGSFRSQISKRSGDSEHLHLLMHDTDDFLTNLSETLDDWLADPPFERPTWLGMLLELEENAHYFEERLFTFLEDHPKLADKLRCLLATKLSPHFAVEKPSSSPMGHVRAFITSSVSTQTEVAEQVENFAVNDLNDALLSALESCRRILDEIAVESSPQSQSASSKIQMLMRYLSAVEMHALLPYQYACSSFSQLCGDSFLSYVTSNIHLFEAALEVYFRQLLTLPHSSSMLLHGSQSAAVPNDALPGKSSACPSSADLHGDSAVMIFDGEHLLRSGVLRRKFATTETNQERPWALAENFARALASVPFCCNVVQYLRWFANFEEAMGSIEVAFCRLCQSDVSLLPADVQRMLSDCVFAQFGSTSFVKLEALPNISDFGLIARRLDAHRLVEIAASAWYSCSANQNWASVVQDLNHELATVLRELSVKGQATRLVLDALSLCPGELLDCIGLSIFCAALAIATPEQAVDSLLHDAASTVGERRLLQYIGYLQKSPLGGKTVLHSEDVQFSSSFTSDPKIEQSAKTEQVSYPGGFESVLGADAVERQVIVSPEEATALFRSIRQSMGVDLDVTENSSVIAELQARCQRATAKLSKELYAKEVHFLLELIQNADDNQYAVGVTPRLQFTLDPSLLVVECNELGFQPSHVRSICDIDLSTKKRAQANGRRGYIGQKGIGFKSVFKVSNQPTIHSGNFHFMFDATQQGMGYTLPIEVAAPSLWTPGVSDTRIELPLSDEGHDRYDEYGTFFEVQNGLVRMGPQLLLFLRQISEICVVAKNPAEGTSWRRKTSKQIIRTDIQGRPVEFVSIAEQITRRTRDHDADFVASTRETWYTYSEHHDCDIAHGALPHVNGTTIKVAFRASDSCVATASRPPPCEVFAFLPLRNYGFRFIIQADWIVPSSREALDQSSPWNRWIRQVLPSIIATAVQTRVTGIFHSVHDPDTRAGSDEERNWTASAQIVEVLTALPLFGELQDFFAGMEGTLTERLRGVPLIPVNGFEMLAEPSRILVRSLEDRASVELVHRCSHIIRQRGLYMMDETFVLPTACQKILGMQECDEKFWVGMLRNICSELSTKSTGKEQWDIILDLISIIRSTPLLREVEFLPLSVSEVGIRLVQPSASSPVFLSPSLSGQDFCMADTVDGRIPLLDAQFSNCCFERPQIVQLLHRLGVFRLDSHEFYDWLLSNILCRPLDGFEAPYAFDLLDNMIVALWNHVSSAECIVCAKRGWQSELGRTLSRKGCWLPCKQVYSNGEEPCVRWYQLESHIPYPREGSSMPHKQLLPGGSPEGYLWLLVSPAVQEIGLADVLAIPDIFYRRVVERPLQEYVCALQATFKDPRLRSPYIHDCFDKLSQLCERYPSALMTDCDAPEFRDITERLSRDVNNGGAAASLFQFIESLCTPEVDNHSVWEGLLEVSSFKEHAGPSAPSWRCELSYPSNIAIYLAGLHWVPYAAMASASVVHIRPMDTIMLDSCNSLVRRAFQTFPSSCKVIQAATGVRPTPSFEECLAAIDVLKDLHLSLSSVDMFFIYQTMSKMPDCTARVSRQPIGQRFYVPRSAVEVGNSPLSDCFVGAESLCLRRVSAIASLSVACSMWCVVEYYQDAGGTTDEIASCFRTLGVSDVPTMSFYLNLLSTIRIDDPSIGRLQDVYKMCVLNLCSQPSGTLLDFALPTVAGNWQFLSQLRFFWMNGRQVREPINKQPIPKFLHEIVGLCPELTDRAERELLEAYFERWNIVNLQEHMYVGFDSLMRRASPAFQEMYLFPRLRQLGQIVLSCLKNVDGFDDDLQCSAKVALQKARVSSVPHLLAQVKAVDPRRASPFLISSAAIEFGFVVDSDSTITLLVVSSEDATTSSDRDAIEESLRRIFLQREDCFNFLHALTTVLCRLTSRQIRYVDKTHCVTTEATVSHVGEDDVWRAVASMREELMDMYAVCDAASIPDDPDSWYFGLITRPESPTAHDSCKEDAYPVGSALDGQDVNDMEAQLSKMAKTAEKDAQNLPSSNRNRHRGHQLDRSGLRTVNEFSSHAASSARDDSHHLYLGGLRTSQDHLLELNVMSPENLAAPSIPASLMKWQNSRFDESVSSSRDEFGRRGEELALLALREHYRGWEIQWMNENVESYLPYDFRVVPPRVRSDDKDLDSLMIEVKTSADENAGVHFSAQELKYAFDHRENYCVLWVIHSSSRNLASSSENHASCWSFRYYPHFSKFLHTKSVLIVCHFDQNGHSS
jgi:hypothetical protein